MGPGKKEWNGTASGVSKGGPKDPRVRKVIALMRVYYDRELTLGRLAEAVHLSVWHLSHLFKTETGIPPAQFLKSIRMEEARRLLASTLLSVKEVVNRVGMSDQSHFVKDFKKAYGHTPTKYRCAHAPAGQSTGHGGAVRSDLHHPNGDGLQSSAAPPK
jgi:AraC-like DNA-binding protein